MHLAVDMYIDSFFGGSVWDFNIILLFLKYNYHHHLYHYILLIRCLEEN